jgi:hypothetical protein
MGPIERGVLDISLEPVIGLAEGETRWRGMTAIVAASMCLYSSNNWHRRNYSAANTALAMSAVPLLPPNSIGLIPSV